MEPDRAHPLGHQRAPEFDAVAGVDGLLPVKRQAVGVFRHRNLRQRRLGRQAGFDDGLGGRRLQDRRGFFVGVFRADRHDQPEARPHDVESDALFLADLDPLFAFELRRNLGLQNFLDPLQMRRKRGLSCDALRGFVAALAVSRVSTAAIPVSASSNTKLCCSASSGVSFSERLPKRPRRSVFRIDVSRSISTFAAAFDRVRSSTCAFRLRVSERKVSASVLLARACASKRSRAPLLQEPAL